MWWMENLRENVIKPSDFPQFQRFVIPLVDDVKKVPENENLVKSYSLDHKATAVREGGRIILTPEIIYEEKGLEYPCINQDYRFKKHSFTYVSGTINENWFRNKICKVNSETKELVQYKENDYVFPGEPVFIARPKAKEEDDGVIVSAMTDVRDGHQDFLLFLDKDLQEMARATFQNQIPYALHGIFMQDC
ncbi:unnamed protein product [Allacma fusca]|uniref:Uncharacterized protein n=2 Tax=Allacma fusca TaxID=39272 RepID=A0A8J2L303_9HEXA|nr:unnamed protein product [Allacma fusca]